ncbi:hypothetical protein [Treponema zioleckii]|uniref:hypothetical protein n=1 Tax=Treponema zioleckii TaxID=331680 RepID=UPI00168A45D6|nr:hypothetical protein [Treponema zioleckii]
MKKILNSLFALLLAGAMIFGFASCSDDDDDDKKEAEVNVVGTYAVTGYTYESTEEDGSSYVCAVTMPTSTSLHYVGTDIDKSDEAVYEKLEYDVTVTKNGDDYTVTKNKFKADGEDGSEDLFSAMEDRWKPNDSDTEHENSWADRTEEFGMTITTTADGTWSDNEESKPTSGTYTVDKANSKILLTTLVDEGETLTEPELSELPYSDGGKTIVMVMNDTDEEHNSTTKVTITLKKN